YASARDLLQDLKHLQLQISSATQATAAISQLVRRPRVAGIFFLLLLASAVAAVWWYRHDAPRRWARSQAIPQITQPMEKGQYFGAYRLARRAERYFPDDPALTRLRLNYSSLRTIETEPPSADVYVKEYSDEKGDWEYLGKSPLQVTLPFANYHWKVE